jgi:hypothetical protein
MVITVPRSIDVLTMHGAYAGDSIFWLVDFIGQ